MTRPRATVSPGDALGSTIADTKSRVVALENVAHSHATPVSALMPVGTIVDYVGTVAPAGWLILNGSTVSGGQTLYPSLWAVLPATFKSGSNIVLPDTRGRVTVGLNPSDVDFDAIGDIGGAKTVALSTAEMPAHTHDIQRSAVQGAAGAVAIYGLQQNSGTVVSATQSTGSGSAHNNVQPFITFSKIMKAV